jgi:hypothetical protein
MHKVRSERASVKQKGRMNSERRRSRANEFVVLFVASLTNEVRTTKWHQSNAVYPRQGALAASEKVSEERTP